MNRKKIGDRGEEEAVQFLLASGYKVLERNWRWKKTEVDIIAQSGEILVFIEVKLRKNEKFGYPEEFVTAAQQERIELAAEEYCEIMQWNGDVRFDIISILESHYPNHLDHFEDAF